MIFPYILPNFPTFSAKLEVKQAMLFLKSYGRLYRVFINDFVKVSDSYIDQKAVCELEMVSFSPIS